jgi:hypothetical protein
VSGSRLLDLAWSYSSVTEDEEHAALARASEAGQLWGHGGTRIGPGDKRPVAIDPEETSPGRGASRGEIRDPLLSDADRFLAKSSPISIRWSLNLERTLRHL